MKTPYLVTISKEPTEEEAIMVCLGPFAVAQGNKIR